MNWRSLLTGPYEKALSQMEGWAERRSTRAHHNFLLLHECDLPEKAQYERGRADAYDDMMEHIIRLRQMGARR